MGTKVKFAVWHRVGRLLVAKPPDWPRNVEYSCTEQSDLIAWARNHGYVLKDGDVQRRDRNDGKRYAAKYG